MNVWKKISALTFVLALALALSVSAFASDPVNPSDPAPTAEAPAKLGQGDGTTDKTGVLGAKSYANKTVDNLSTTVKIQKDIVVYNANTYTQANQKVAAPNFSYTYTVTPENTLKSVTDSDTISVKTKAGITTGLKVNNGATGTAANAVGTYGFTNADYFDAGPNGATNTYWIPLDFSEVDFTGTSTGSGYGVYRYKIVETLTQPESGSLDYANLSMMNGTMNIVYLDVYVDGAGAIYGYVCLPGVVNEGTSGVAETGNVDVVASPETTKINGFVKKTADADPDGADYYYTYDLTLSKTVVNDNYTVAQNHEFPFTVFFEQPSADTTQLGNYFTIKQTVSTTGGESPSPTATGLTSIPTNAKAWSGVVKIRDSASIVYSGIPCGIDAIVFETNDVSNVTYKVTTTVSSAATSSADTAVTATTTPNSAEKQAANKADSQSTAVTFNTEVATELSTAQSCAITNELVNISPTGVTLRYAPYLLTLGAGVTVLPLTRRYKKREEDLV